MSQRFLCLGRTKSNGKFLTALITILVQNLVQLPIIHQEYKKISHKYLSDKREFLIISTQVHLDTAQLSRFLDIFHNIHAGHAKFNRKPPWLLLIHTSKYNCAISGGNLVSILISIFQILTFNLYRTCDPVHISGYFLWDLFFICYNNAKFRNFQILACFNMSDPQHVKKQNHESAFQSPGRDIYAQDPSDITSLIHHRWATVFSDKFVAATNTYMTAQHLHSTMQRMNSHSHLNKECLRLSVPIIFYTLSTHVDQFLTQNYV
jgi:hypothetical protein